MAIEKNNSLQSTQRDIMTDKHQLNVIKEDNRELITNWDGIVEKAAAFYKQLCKPRNKLRQKKTKPNKYKRYLSNINASSRKTN